MIAATHTAYGQVPSITAAVLVTITGTWRMAVSLMAVIELILTPFLCAVSRI